MVRCTLSDGAASIGPLEMRAYLAEQDDVPTLIGMLGFIERDTLHGAETGLSPTTALPLPNPIAGSRPIT